MWSCWTDAVNQSKRDRDLEGGQRVFEEDLKNAQKDAEQLRIEAQKADERHHDLHLKRQAIFAWTIDGRDNNMVMQIAWSAWRECMQDARVAEVASLKQKLDQMKKDHSMMSLDLGALQSAMAPPPPPPPPEKDGKSKGGRSQGGIGRFFRCFR